MRKTKIPRIRCPKCGSCEVLQIIYGLPGKSLMDEERRGEVELGGCVITGNDPNFRCKSCLEAFR